MGQSTEFYGCELYSLTREIYLRCDASMRPAVLWKDYDLHRMEWITLQQLFLGGHRTVYLLFQQTSHKLGVLHTKWSISGTQRGTLELSDMN